MRRAARAPATAQERGAWPRAGSAPRAWPQAAPPPPPSSSSSAAAAAVSAATPAAGVGGGFGPAAPTVAKLRASCGGSLDSLNLLQRLDADPDGVLPQTEAELALFYQQQIMEAQQRHLEPLREDLADWLNKILGQCSLRFVSLRHSAVFLFVRFLFFLRRQSCHLRMRRRGNPSTETKKGGPFYRTFSIISSVLFYFIEKEPVFFPPRLTKSGPTEKKSSRSFFTELNRVY